jgi:hypothetical protein
LRSEQKVALTMSEANGNEIRGRVLNQMPLPAKLPGQLVNGPMPLIGDQFQENAAFYPSRLINWTRVSYG